VCVYLRN